jgi:hypothetical protein
LYYTSKAVQMLPDSELSKKSSLIFALKLKLTSLLTFLGRFDEALQLLDEEIEKIQDKYTPPFRFPINQRISLLLLSKSETLLAKGDDSSSSSANSSSELAINGLFESVQHYPCNIQSYFILSQALTVSKDSVSYQKKERVDTLLSLTESTLSSFYYDSMTGSILLLSSLKDKIICRISKKNSMNMITEELYKYSYFHRPVENSDIDHDGDNEDTDSDYDSTNEEDVDILRVDYDESTDLFQQSSQIKISSSSVATFSSVVDVTTSPLVTSLFPLPQVGASVKDLQVGTMVSERMKPESVSLVSYLLSSLHWSLFILYDSMNSTSSSTSSSSSSSITAWNHFLAMRHYERIRLENWFSSTATTARYSPYNNSLTAERVKWIEKTFSVDYWKQYETERKEVREFLGQVKKKEENDKSQTVDEEVEIIPVFIIGFLRSGSTLLEHLLESSPVSSMTDSSRIDNPNPSTQRDENIEEATVTIWSLGEASILATYIVPLQKSLARLNSSSLKGKRKLLEEEKLFSFYRKRILSDMKDKYENYYNGLSSFNDSSLESNFSRSFPCTFYSKRSNDDKEECSVSKGSLSMRRRKKLYIVDKLLLNYYNVPYIQMLFPSASASRSASLSAFPSAYILHITRDPLDCLFSCMKTRFASENTLSYILYDSSLIHEYSAYLQLMSHYEKSLPYISSVMDSSINKERKHETTANRNSSRILTIKYEELIHNSCFVLQDVISFLNINRSISSGASVRKTTSKYVNTASFLQVKQSPYLSSVGSWKKYSNQLSGMFMTFNSKIRL